MIFGPLNSISAELSASLENPTVLLTVPPTTIEVRIFASCIIGVKNPFVACHCCWACCTAERMSSADFAAAPALPAGFRIAGRQSR